MFLEQHKTQLPIPRINQNVWFVPVVGLGLAATEMMIRRPTHAHAAPRCRPCRLTGWCDSIRSLLPQITMRSAGWQQHFCRLLGPTRNDRVKPIDAGADTNPLKESIQMSSTVPKCELSVFLMHSSCCCQRSVTSCPCVAPYVTLHTDRYRSGCDNSRVEADRNSEGGRSRGRRPQQNLATNCSNPQEQER